MDDAPKQRRISHKAERERPLRQLHDSIFGYQNAIPLEGEFFDMAYFYNPYQPNYFGNPYQMQTVQPVPQMQQQVMQQPVQQTVSYQAPSQGQQPIPQPMQQNGVVCVKSISEVESWNVAPGNNQLFYIETTPPLIASKSKGFSPIENPVTKYYDLFERTSAFASQNAKEGEQHIEKENVRHMEEYALKSDLVKAQRDIDDLRLSFNALNEQKPKKRVLVKEDDGDE